MPIASSLLKKPRLVKKLKDFYEYVKYNDGKVGTKTRGIDLNFNNVVFEMQILPLISRIMLKNI